MSHITILIDTEKAGLGSDAYAVPIILGLFTDRIVADGAVKHTVFETGANGLFAAMDIKPGI